MRLKAQIYTRGAPWTRVVIKQDRRPFTQYTLNPYTPLYRELTDDETKIVVLILLAHKTRKYGSNPGHNVGWVDRWSYSEIALHVRFGE